VVSLTVDPFTNRISTFGFSYDAAGNLIQWPGGTVTIGAEYDVEGRMSRVTWDGSVVEQHLYDARNRRVKSGGTLQLYGLGGELLGEYERVQGQWAPGMVRERVYFAGLWVGTVEGDGSWSMPNTDRLGSLKQGSRRYPFGDGNESYAYDEYATYRKDTASAHYYAWHRWYSATWGRFSSPDPYVMSGGLTNPQGWNRYSYVANDPVNFYDPAGLHAQRPVVVTPPITVTAWVSPLEMIMGTYGAEFGGAGWGDIAGGPFQYMPNGTGEEAGGGSPGGGEEGKASSQASLASDFSRCMARYANDFSILGVAESIVEAVTGVESRLRDTEIGGAVGGNTFTTILFGEVRSNAAGLAVNGPGIVNDAMGRTRSYGRRTTDILSLNLSGKGGVPLALGRSAIEFRTAMKATSRILGLGMSLSQRLAIDAALALAEAGYCGRKTKDRP
jgi:RHS repeat-associated protein